MSEETATFGQIESLPDRLRVLAQSINHRTPIDVQSRSE
jgi:hypothetical protein